MPKKYEPTPEERQQIVDWYQETKNYAEVSRRCGLSTLIVKRIVTESQVDKNNKVIPDKVELSCATATIPIEQPRSWMKGEASEVYYHYYELLKKTSEEIRVNNGIL